MPQREEVVLRLPLSADAEAPAVAALDRLLSRHDIERRLAGQVRFALVEACLNAIEYGRPRESEMEVRLRVDPREVWMSVSNFGLPFQPGAATPASAPRRGHGLKIIQAMMDHVRYLDSGRGTCVEMSKQLATS